MKKIFIHSLLAGVLAGIASLVYNHFYCAALMVDFSKVIGFAAVLGSSVFGTVIAGLGYYVLWRKWGVKVDVWFNAIFILLSLISFMGPLIARLPLEVLSPELFVGATIPMHLFPVIFWLALKPIFGQETKG